MFVPFAFMKSPGGATFTGLLDTYGGAEVAYSLRRLSGAYTGAAIKVRRGSDNATQDIGFVGEDLDTTALSSFIGSDSAYVERWYDQSGNGNNAVQTTTAFQPIIALAGAIIYVNSKPAFQFDGSNDYFDLTSNVPTSAASAWAWVLDRHLSNDNTISLGTTNAATPYGPFWFQDTNFYYAPPTSGGGGRPSSATGQHLVFAEAGSSPWQLYLNGSEVTAGNGNYTYSATNYNTLGRRNANYTSANNEYQEFILWNIDQTSNRTGIENNINTYFSIYP